MEQLKTNNEEMKKLIQDICFQIEDKIKSSTQTHIPTTELSLLNDEFIPLHQTITRYKDSITQLKAKLEGFYNLRRIVSMEQEVKVKKEQLYSVKYENNVLCNIQKTQSKAIIQYQNKYENKNEINTLTEKLRVLKEEYKYSREMQRSTEIKLKTQNAAIVALEEKCKVIRENIEYKKKKMENQEGNKVNPDENEIGRLSTLVDQTEIEVNSEEKNYKAEINRQTSLMTRLKDDLALLNIQIKDKEQEIRICELKLKEITKANRTTHVQRVGNRRLTDKGRNETKTNRSPSAKLTNRNKSHNNISKPFPNVKFNNNSTDYKTKVNVFNKEEMLNQIENLKNEIKTALNINNITSEKLLTTNLEDESQILNDNNILDQKFIDQSGLLSNKDIFEKIDMSEIKQTKEERRQSKPFKPFLFDK